MASAAVCTLLLPHPTTLCPPPLQLQKKARRAIIRRRILRKSTTTQIQFTHGPLDDIIEVIKSDIRETLPSCDLSLSLLEEAQPVCALSTQVVTHMPVSRAPRDQPLTIRKNRNSCSSTSESSMGDPMSSSRQTSQDEAMQVGAVGTPLILDTTPFPPFDASTSHEPTHAADAHYTTTYAEHINARQSFESTAESVESRSGNTGQRRPSILRRFTTRLRRSGTGDTTTSAGDVSEATPRTIGTSPPLPEIVAEYQTGNEPSDKAMEAYIKKNALKSTELSAMMERMTMERIAKRLPTPAEDEYDSVQQVSLKANIVPTTIRPAVRIFPESKTLQKGLQEFNVAIEIEGVLQNRDLVPNIAIDVVFVVDNGYYVTKDCLGRATDAVNGALYRMQRGDRLALYTTHCAHNTVTGNRPELHYPLRPFGTESEDIFQDLTACIYQHGTQAWEPTRPNPSMTDVVLAVAKSLKNDNIKKERTHIILLSPAAYVLHGVSKSFPDLYIHRINPGVLPYCRESEPKDAVCFDNCCRNIFVGNWSSYQSVPRRINQILKDARSQGPVGELTNVTIDLRTREGCELIECVGHKYITHLRFGQVHTIFARFHVDRSKTQPVDLDSSNPIFNSSLNVKGLRQELQNAVALGATKVHLFDVQLYHHNSIHAPDSWNYSEAPFTIIREPGRIAPPLDATMEYYKRQYFHTFTHLPTSEAKIEADNLLAMLDLNNELARKAVERMVWEINCHEAIRRYEHEYRQKLPLCPGPTDLEAPHEWLLDLWNRKKSKRHGIASGIGGGGISGLIGSGI